MIGTTETISIDREYAFVELPPAKWEVSIPRGGHFKYYTPDKLTIWQRFWMRFIGWGVEPYEK